MSQIEEGEENDGRFELPVNKVFPLMTKFGYWWTREPDQYYMIQSPECWNVRKRRRVEAFDREE